jgi:metal-dependent amidase/aminoacylase/carboxypeptidase family protein
MKTPYELWEGRKPDVSADANAYFQSAFSEYFVQNHFVADKRVRASEDFSVFATSIKKSHYFWMFGGVNQKKWDELALSNKLDTLPSNHSPFFAPVIQPTLQAGTDALAVAALTLLGK